MLLDAGCQLFFISALDKWHINSYYVANWHYTTMDMIIKTRVFDLCNGKFRNLSELAQAMGLSVSQVYRVREGKRNINHKFVVGAKMAFPYYRLDELFYLDSESLDGNNIEPIVTSRYNHIVQQYTS